MEEVIYTKISDDLIEQKIITPPVPQTEEVKTASVTELMADLVKELDMVNKVIAGILETNNVEELQARADNIQKNINNLNTEAIKTIEIKIWRTEYQKTHQKLFTTCLKI